MSDSKAGSMAASMAWLIAIGAGASVIVVLSAREHVATFTHMVKRSLMGLKPLNYLMRRIFRRSSRSRPTAPLLPPPPER